jgi:hypothetical protein
MNSIQHSDYGASNFPSLSTSADLDCSILGGGSMREGNSVTFRDKTE